MKAAVVKETSPGEHRVALVPEAISRLRPAGIDVLVESGAVDGAWLSDAAYADGTALPFLISLSYAPGVAVANATIAAVGTDGDIRLYNSGSATVAVNVDLTGSYYAYP